MTPRLRQLLAQLIRGCEVPRSLGILGTAEKPFDELYSYLGLFGYPDVDKIEAALQHIENEHLPLNPAVQQPDH